MSTAVVGVGATAYSRSSGRSTLGLAVEACRDALDDAGLRIADVDGIATFEMDDSIPPLEVAYALGQNEVSWSPCFHGGANLLTHAILSATVAIEAGYCRAVLIYRSLNGRSGRRLGMSGAQDLAPGDPFDTPAGYVVPPQFLAMWARRHQYVYGSTSEDLGQIAVTQRAHAAANPVAICRDLLTMEKYLAGRWINEPFRIYDCSYEVDAGVAIVIAAEPVARSAASRPVWFVGAAESQGYGQYTWNQNPDLTSMYSSVAGPRLWAKTGLAPADIDVACMYDCFTYTVMATLEDFGFCGKGEVGQFYRSGRATYGGDVVVNPHGGLLSEGYVHGLNHHVEAVRQLRGQCGDRQVADARLALVTSGAGSVGGGLIYSSERP